MANKYPPHACQHCGSEVVLVDTSIYDRFYWNPTTKRYEADGFMDEFTHTGNNICGGCDEEWTGADPDAGLDDGDAI